MPEHEMLSVARDAFSSGQVSSKIWLCEELERLSWQRPQVIWVYGGWHGIMSLLLLSRGRMPIKHIRSFDVDPSCEETADALMENWVWQGWTFKALTVDCNGMDPLSSEPSARPDVIVNTSTEHFTSTAWFDSIPTGTMVALQSNDMDNEDHHSCVKNLEEMKKMFPLTDIMYEGRLHFAYPTWDFNRFMIIGRK